MDEKPSFAPRRAKPGQTFDYTDMEGNQQRLKADSKGVVTPKDQRGQDVLDAFDLPQARVAASKAKADTTADEPAAPEAEAETAKDGE
jgi:hypothetical protein